MFFLYYFFLQKVNPAFFIAENSEKQFLIYTQMKRIVMLKIIILI